MIIKNDLEKILGKGRVKANFNLGNFLTIKIDNIAPFFFEAESRDDWLKAKQASLQLKMPLVILGGGSNLVLTKIVPNTLIVKNRYIKIEKIKEDQNDVYLLLSSGVPVTRLVRETIRDGHAGLEYHLGLPGTVGGAIYMNSKWTRPINYFGDRLFSAKLIDSSGKIKEVKRDYFQFAYDFSVLQNTHEILLEAVFKLKKDNPAILAKRADIAFEYRRQTQPFGVATCGCFFKNIDTQIQKKMNLPTTSSGYLIDKAGLKGFQVGNFAISKKHANFVINKGGGKSEDLLKLLQIIKERVRSRFGVELQEEVVIK